MSFDDITLGELGRRLDTIQSEITGIRQDAVLRAEYQTRMTGFDREIRDLKADVSLAAVQCAVAIGLAPQVEALKKANEQRTMPWPTVAAVIVSLVALSLDLIPRLVS